MLTNLPYMRGTTQTGQKGWIAWLEADETRAVFVKPGKCTSSDGRTCTIQTDDGEHLLTVPTGRLDHSPEAALERLAIDVRAEGEAAMRFVDEQIAKLSKERAGRATQLLLDLVAIEMQKAKSRGADAGDVQKLGESLKRLEN